MCYLRELAAVSLLSLNVGCATPKSPALVVTTVLDQSITETVESATLPPRATALPTPSPTPLAPPERVIVVSVEGGRADWLSGWMQDGTMPILARLSEQSIWRTVQGVDPAVSAVAHNSLASGSIPAHMGIVGDRVHRPEDGLYWYTSGFDLPMSPPAKPLWVAAREAGLTTAAVFWPGATPALPDQLANYTVGYGERVAYSKLHQLNFYQAQGWENVPSTAFRLQESQFQIEGDDGILLTAYVLAYQDGSGNPSFLLSTDRIIDDADPLLESWTGWSFDSGNGLGASFLITNPDLENFTLYQSGVYRMMATPEDFRQALLDQHGYFKPPPDYYALEHGWIDEEDFLVMLEWQSLWMASVSGWIYDTYQPDLLMTVQSPLDQAGHQFLLTEERQSGYSAERADAYEGHLIHAAAQLDRSIDSLLMSAEEDIESGTTALFIVGTTGMAPIHTQINLNILLEEAGLLRLGSGGFVIVQRSQAIAFTSGGSAHLYINLIGRESAGIVPASDYAAVQDQIIELLTGLTDPTTGEPIFARVLRREELTAYGLEGLYAGDIFVQANEGYYLSDDREAATVFAPTVFYGQQGYDSTLPEMQGGLIIAGRGSALDTNDPIRLIDLAPTIANLLGFSLPDEDGHPLALP